MEGMQTKAPKAKKTAEQKAVLAALRRRTVRPSRAEMAEAAGRAGLPVAAVATWCIRRNWKEGVNKRKSRSPSPEDGEEEAETTRKTVKKRKEKKNKTDEQVEALRELKKKTLEPSTTQVEELAVDTGLSQDVVRRWFANQRFMAKMNKDKVVKKEMSPDQLKQLVALCELTVDPSQEQKEEVALKTGLTMEEVTLWFAKRARKKTKMPQQVASLRALWKETREPSKAKREEVAAATGLSVKAVNQWFSNQHLNAKRSKKKYYQSALLPPEAWELQCQLCVYTPAPRRTGAMEKLKAVLAHYAKMHLKDRLAETIPRSSLACPTCSYTTTNWCNLRYHWCTVHSTLQTWVREVRNDGPKELEKLQCKDCSRKFLSSRSLKKHKAIVHEPKKSCDQIKCDFCDYTMLEKSDVAQTLRAMLYHQARVVKF